MQVHNCSRVLTAPVRPCHCCMFAIRKGLLIVLLLVGTGSPIVYMYFDNMDVW